MTLVPWEINKFCSPRNSVSLGFPSRKIATHKKQNKLFSEVSVLSMLYWFLPFLLRRDNTSTWLATDAPCLTAVSAIARFILASSCCP